MTPRICLEVWGGDPNELVGIARHAEAIGLDGVYLGESPTALNAETWTTLGAIAAVTDRIRLGPVIANLLPDYRSAALLARQGAALAVLSEGRFDFRTGVGASEAAGRAWWAPAGVAYPPYTERLKEAERELGELRTAWANDDLPTIEVTIAATSERALALAARFGQRWETSFATLVEWRERAAVAPSHLKSSLEIDAFVGSESDPEQVWRDVVATRGDENLDAIRDRALVGAPTHVADQLQALAAAGGGQLVVAPHDPSDLTALSRLAEAVALAR